MQVKTLDLNCKQGATFKLNTIYYDPLKNPIDLTGFTAKMQVRTSKCDEGCSELIIELSTTNGRITLGGVNGNVDFTIDATTTATLPIGTFYYDVFLDSGSEESLYFEGTFTVEGRITQ